MDLPDSDRVSRVPSYSTHYEINLIVLVIIRFLTLGVPGFHSLWPTFPDRSARLRNFLPYAGW